MMRMPASAAVVLALLTAGAPAPARAQGSAPQKIGFVNSRAILARTPGYAAAESTFTREMDSFRAEVTRLQSALDSAASEFEQSSVLLSPTARQAKRKDLEAQQQKLEQRTAELRDKAAARERDLLDPIQARITSVIEGIRAEGNFAVIFDLSAPGSGVMAADKGLDLTERVIARLQTAK